MPGSEDFEIVVLTDADEIMAARRLHARRYVDAGFVDHLSRDGVIDDAWVDVATYLGARTSVGDIIGVSRNIPYTLERSLPVFGDMALFDERWDWITDIDLNRTSEFSALAVAREAGIRTGRSISKALFRAMFHMSVVVDDHDYWFAALDQRVMRHLMKAHDFLFEPIGPPQEYLGSVTVPVVVDLVGQGRHYALTSPERHAYFMAGVELDLTGDRARIRASTGEFVPRRPAVRLS